MATIDETINEAFKPIASAFNDLVFYSIPIGESQLPLIVVWLIAGALYFTFYLRLLISVALHMQFELFLEKKIKQTRHMERFLISKH